MPFIHDTTVIHNNHADAVWQVLLHLRMDASLSKDAQDSWVINTGAAGFLLTDCNDLRNYVVRCKIDVCTEETEQLTEQN